MANIAIAGGVLNIALSPADKLWSMHGSFALPLTHVAGAQAATESGWNYAFNKLLGTNAPGIKIAGTYFTGNGLVFCDFGNGQNCIEITTSHEHYAKIIVELNPEEDRDAVVAQINAAAAAR